jgi:hypothetical protein
MISLTQERGSASSLIKYHKKCPNLRSSIGRGSFKLNAKREKAALSNDIQQFDIENQRLIRANVATGSGFTVS